MNNLAQTNPDWVTPTFCIFDDLMKTINPNQSHAGRPRDVTGSEAATMCLIKAAYAITPLKACYRLIKERFTAEFKLPTYKSFVESMNNYTPHFMLMISILLSIRNKKAGIVKITDSTPLPVCKNIRINLHKVMKRIATRYKTTTGYFYGLKLHVISDHKGNLLQVIFTTANVDDRVVLDRFLDTLYHNLILADAGYISPKLVKKAYQHNNLLLTGMRKNMKRLATQLEIDLLNLRIHVEHLFSVLKERYGLITSLPRSEKGYLAHYVRSIFAYLYLPLVIS